MYIFYDGTRREKKEKMKKYILFILIISFVFFSFEKSYSKNNLNIRVCVAGDRSKIALSVKGPYKIEAIDKEFVLDKGRYLRKEYILPTNSGIRLGNKYFKIYGIRIIPRKDSSIYIDKTRFRGIVDIIRTEDKKLLVINHLNIEEYLYGVLYHEMPHYWPLNTLKAQAVAARTFAVHRIEIMKDRDYDVTSDIYSQVYGGRSSERRITRKAVDSTRGQILTYDDKILPAYYHSICGGHTENASIVFGINLPPLKGVKCPYCKGAAGEYWKAQFSYKQIEKKLNEYGIKVRGLKYIVEGKIDASGRLESIKISDKTGAKEIKAFKFRLALGPNIIRSTNFSITITKRGIIFKGKGWGHGVGMCQWGAFGMAKHRFDYRKILNFYYPDAKIKNYNEIIGF